MVEDQTSVLTGFLYGSRVAETNRQDMYEEEAYESNVSDGKRALEENDDQPRERKTPKLLEFSILKHVANREQDQEQQSDDSFNNGAVDGDGDGGAAADGAADGVGDGGAADGSDVLMEACLIRCSRSDYASIARVNNRLRSLVKSGEIYKLRRRDQIVEHWIYFSCQPLEWIAFDPVQQKRMKLPTMARGCIFECGDKESLAVGTDLLVIGKEYDVSQGFYHIIYKYSILTHSWSTEKNIGFQKCLFGSASLGEIGIFAGGCDSDDRILDSVLMYNSELQSWTTLPKMNKPRKSCSGVFMDGKFYVIGGLTETGSKVLTCGEEYDLGTMEWTEIPGMAPPRSKDTRFLEAPPLVAVVNNELYAADHAGMEVMKFDKKSRAWFSLGKLPERVDTLRGWGIAFKACGDQLIVIGGPESTGGGFLELNAWKPSNDGSPPVWTLLERRLSHNFVSNCAVMGC